MKGVALVFGIALAFSTVFRQTKSLCPGNGRGCSCLDVSCSNCSDGCLSQDGRCVRKCDLGFVQLGDLAVCVEYVDTRSFNATNDILQTFPFGNGKVGLQRMPKGGPVSQFAPNRILLTLDASVDVNTKFKPCSNNSFQGWMIDIEFLFPNSLGLNHGNRLKPRQLLQVNIQSKTGYLEVITSNVSGSLTPITLLKYDGRNWTIPSVNRTQIGAWNRLILVWFPVSQQQVDVLSSFNNDPLQKTTIDGNPMLTFDKITSLGDTQNGETKSVWAVGKFKAFSVGLPSKLEYFNEIYYRIRGCLSYSPRNLECFKCDVGWYLHNGLCNTSCPRGYQMTNASVCVVAPTIMATTIMTESSSLPPSTATPARTTEATSISPTSSDVGRVTLTPTTPPSPTTTAPTTVATTRVSGTTDSPTTAVQRTSDTATPSKASLVRPTTAMPSSAFTDSTVATTLIYPTDGKESKGGDQTVIYIGAGAGGGAILLVVVVVLVVVCVKRRRRRKNIAMGRVRSDSSGVCLNPLYASADDQNSRRSSTVASSSFVDYGADSVRSGKPLNGPSNNVYDEPSTNHTPLKKMISSFYSEPDDPTYWQPASTESELYAQIEGRKFSKIDRKDVVVGKELGSGEFGVVAKGIWTSITRRSRQISVAVKMLNSSSSREDRVKFLREAAIMGQFRHKNVVALYGVVTVGEPVMLILELVENGDLKDRLTDVRASLVDKPSAEEDLKLARLLLRSCSEIAEGMKYLSRKGFVHRDLAARNVILDHEFTCKIGDFGMARDLADDTYYMTSGGKIPIRWTAPEALNFRKYSTASDVWSFGIVLYEIWSLGDRPYGFMENSEVQRLIDIGHRLPPPSGCPRFIYHMMIRCWNPDYHDRPSFSDLAEMLSDDQKNEILRSKPDCHIGAKSDESDSLYKDLQSLYVTN